MEQTWFNSPITNGNFNSMNVFAGGTDTFEINFKGGYLSESHVKAYMYDPNDETGTVEILLLSFITSARVRTSKFVPTNWRCVIYRDTPKQQPLVNFQDGAPQTAKNLDRNAMQAIFSAAEMVDRFESTQGTVSNIGGVVADFTEQVAEIQSINDRVSGQVTSFRTVAGGTSATLTMGRISAYRVGLNQPTTTLRFVAENLVGPVARTTLILRQDTGANKVVWPNNAKWVNGTPPPLSWTQGKEDIFEVMTYDGGNSWYVCYVGGWF